MLVVFMFYDILRYVRDVRRSMKNYSIVEYYIENKRIQNLDEQRRINGEIKRKRKIGGKCRIAITKKEKKCAYD